MAYMKESESALHEGLEEMYDRMPGVTLRCVGCTLRPRCARCTGIGGKQQCCARGREMRERERTRERDGHTCIHTYIHAGRQTGRDGFLLKVRANSH